MCLAIPMKLVERNGRTGVVENAGLRVRVVLELVPSAVIGQFVLVHAGYALSVIDEKEALQTIAALRRLGIESA